MSRRRLPYSAKPFERFVRKSNPCKPGSPMYCRTKIMLYLTPIFYSRTAIPWWTIQSNASKKAIGPKAHYETPLKTILFVFMKCQTNTCVNGRTTFVISVCVYFEDCMKITPRPSNTRSAPFWLVKKSERHIWRKCPWNVLPASYQPRDLTPRTLPF